MQTLIVDRKGVGLAARGERLHIEEPGQKPRQIPMRMVERVVISASITLHSTMIRKLAARGISLLVVDPRSPEDHAWITGPAHNDAARRIRQLRASDNEGTCRRIAAYLLRQKFQGYRVLLLERLDHRPEARSALTRAEQHMSRAIIRVSGEPATLETLRGVEGAAASAWFTAMAALLPESWNFHGRNRRPPRDPVNAMLSLGYTLADGLATHSLLAAGWDPVIGFYHRLEWSRRSLSSDLIEPLRPRVDAWVLRLVAEQTLRPEHFRKRGEGCLLGKAGRGIFYRDWALQMKQELDQQLRRHLKRLGEIVHGDSIVTKHRLSPRQG